MSIFQFERILIGVFVVLLVCIAGVGGYLWQVESEGIPTPEIEVPEGVAIMEGVYACLPRIDGASTSECIPAIKLGEEFFALDLARFIESGGELRFRVGETITVGGIFTPLEAISDEQWDVYRLQGVMEVEEVTR
jgi:hypothetical protein